MPPIGFPRLPAPPAMPAELAHARSLLAKGAAGNLNPGRGDVAAQPHDALDAFAKLIVGKIDETHALRSTAAELVHQMHSDQNVTHSEVLTAVQKADLALSTMLQVRQQLIEAYRELQQIQI